jgi:hypothetical protein
MGQWKCKPKIKKAIPIPPEMQDAMREVVELVAESERNPNDVNNIDFDDAIQIGGLCGGRDRRENPPFYFSWHPGNSRRCRWYFSLHEFEIENIADGNLTELPLFACDSSDCQCGDEDPDFKCFHCDTFIEDA